MRSPVFFMWKRCDSTPPRASLKSRLIEISLRILSDVELRPRTRSNSRRCDESQSSGFTLMSLSFLSLHSLNDYWPHRNRKRMRICIDPLRWSGRCRVLDGLGEPGARLVERCASDDDEARSMDAWRDTASSPLRLRNSCKDFIGLRCFTQASPRYRAAVAASAA